MSVAPAASAAVRSLERGQRLPGRPGSRRGRRARRPRRRRAPPPRRGSAPRPRPAPAGRRRRGITPKRLRPGMSAAVRTAATSGRAAAQPARSPKRKRARGCGERTAFSTRPPGRQTSAPKRLAAVDLGAAVEPRQPRADRGAGRRRCDRSGGGAVRVADRGDDLAVAGAAAEDAAERLLDLGRARVRRAARAARVAAISMPGRADAALGRAVAEEGRLQPRRPPARRGPRRW